MLYLLTLYMDRGHNKLYCKVNNVYFLCPYISYVCSFNYIATIVYRKNYNLSFAIYIISSCIAYCFWTLDLIDQKKM
jgi:hypothetical protein